MNEIDLDSYPRGLLNRQALRVRLERTAEIQGELQVNTASGEIATSAVASIEVTDDLGV